MTVISVHTAWRCTFPCGVVPVGLGDGVGDCPDAAVLLKEDLFISPSIIFGENYVQCFKGMIYFWRLLLNMQVTKREPTPGYHDAYLVGIPKGACGERYGLTYCQTKFSSPSTRRFSGL